MQNHRFVMHLDGFGEDSRAREGIPEPRKLISFDFHVFSLIFIDFYRLLLILVGFQAIWGRRLEQPAAGIWRVFAGICGTLRPLQDSAKK